MESDREEREEELAALSFIFPDELVKESPSSAHITLGICLETPLSVGTDDAASSDHANNITHLPPIRLTFTLPAGYPFHAPPAVEISTTPSWLPPAISASLSSTATTLWEEYGRSPILFSYISHVQEAASTAFELTHLQVSGQEMLNLLLDFDTKASRLEFEKGNYDCGICLDPKPGDRCHRMQCCRSVFCVACLTEAYEGCIKQGNIQDAKCSSLDCEKEDLITPHELLEIGIPRDTVQRYVNLHRKKKLDAERSTIWCPRNWCEGAARGNKYPKPIVPLEKMDSWPSMYPPEDSHTPEPPQPGNDTALSICEDCSFAFCNTCGNSWHGDHIPCPSLNPEPDLIPRNCKRRSKAELEAEEKATARYIALNTSPCPKCRAPVQKTGACNHMICQACQTHFCYLCSAHLPAENPLRHFNDQENQPQCFHRLWILEHGGNEKFVRFEGQRGEQIRKADEERRAAILEEKRKRKEEWQARMEKARQEKATRKEREMERRGHGSDNADGDGEGKDNQYESI